MVASEGMVEGWTEGVALKRAERFGTWMAKTRQVLVLFAHGWMRESVVAHVWRAGEVSPETTLEQLGSVSGIAKNPNGAWGSGAHAGTARHMAFCVHHWWSTAAEVGTSGRVIRGDAGGRAEGVLLGRGQVL